jgi:Uma2 family endonuclease
MSAVAERFQPTTADDWNVPDGFELVDGRLEELHMSMDSAWVGLELGSLLRNHCVAGGLGRVFGSDAGYRCFPARPRLLRKPDLSFIRQERLPRDRPLGGESRIVPDLAVEIVSPNDLAENLQEKVLDYLGAGVRLVWVVYISARMGVIFRPDGSAAWVGEDGGLDGEGVVPGFRCRLGDILPPPVQAVDSDKTATDE